MFKILITLTFLFLNVYGLDKIKIGVLAYGTVNWELKTLKDNKLDKKNNYELEFVKLASKNAQLIALQSGSVDIIVNDWIWVNSQRAVNKNYTFYPYSKATGTIYSNSNVKKLIDLRNKRIGIAGGSNDKTWLILRAYYKKKYNIDLLDITEPVYAGAPILYKKMIDKSLDAAINYWHFNSKLKSKGLNATIEMKDLLSELGIKSDVSFIGWTFREDFAKENKNLIRSFINSTHDAKNLLLKDNNQWEKLKKTMKVKSNEEFESLKDGYKKGVIFEFNDDNLEASNKLYNLLKKQGGNKFIGKSIYLDENTFWKF